jgi:MYXO-CTERM domain-containing protein
VLNYWAWFQALDYSSPMMVQDAVGVSLLLEGSTDGGSSWTTLDTVDSIQPVWQPRQVALDGIVDTSGQLLLRFTATNPVATTAVEAGIDQLSVVTLTAACNPDRPGPVTATPAAGGCSLGGHAPASGLVALLLLAAVVFLRRRRFA